MRDKCEKCDIFHACVEPSSLARWQHDTTALFFAAFLYIKKLFCLYSNNQRIIWSTKKGSIELFLPDISRIAATIKCVRLNFRKILFFRTQNEMELMKFFSKNIILPTNMDMNGKISPKETVGNTLKRQFPIDPNFIQAYVSKNKKNHSCFRVNT